MKSLGIGLIGSGYMGKCHALAWNAVAPVFGDVTRPRLVALADASPELATRQAAALGFERGVGDWRELLQDPDIDVISVTAPNAFHPEMAIAALEAGKHVWCEKPMAIRHEDARAMAEAAKHSAPVAVLGYNYIQNPMIRLAKTLIDEGRIGKITQVRLEMDEDFMADPEALFYWKSEASSGYGVPDDFAVHPLSLLHMLVGPVDRLVSDMAKPYEKRLQKDGPPRKVETFDIASMLFRTAGGVSGTLQVNRAAWGRKGRIALQIFGAKGSIVYDQERMNELQLYVSAGAESEQGFRTILAGPAHSPYGQFIPAPGHGLGFNDLKITECREMIRAIDGEPAHIVDFAAGLAIEDTVHAIARSFESQSWVSLGTDGSRGNL